MYVSMAIALFLQGEDASLAQIEQIRSPQAESVCVCIYMYIYKPAYIHVLISSTLTHAILFIQTHTHMHT